MKMITFLQVSLKYRLYRVQPVRNHQTMNVEKYQLFCTLNFEYFNMIT